MKGAAPPLQLLVFDSRRGNQEGSEDDKVLASFPNQGPIEAQSALAGLLQGLLLFCSTFGQSAWEVAETDKSTWVLLEAEPHIWFAAAAPRSLLPRHVTEASLRAVLAQAHMLTTLLCGSVQSLLDLDDTATTAQEALLPVLRHLGRALAVPTSWHARELRNPLSPGAAYPTLPLPPTAAAALQTCANRVLLGSLDASAAGRGGSGGAGTSVQPVAELAVLYGQEHVLWGSLPPADMAALYCFLASVLLHPSPSSGGSAGSASAAAAATAALGTCAASPATLLDSSAWQLLPSGFIVLRSGGLEAAVGSDAAPAVAVPVVHLTTSGQRLRLLPLAQGKLLAVLLLDPGVPLTSSLLALLHQALTAPAAEVAAQVAETVRASKCEAGHVPGYRFVCQRSEEHSAQASPRAMISASSHHARALAAGLSDSLGRLAGAAGQPLGVMEVEEGAEPAPEQHPGSSGGGSRWQALDAGPPREVLVRSSQDCWAAAVADPDRTLLLVRERRSERGLAEAGDAVEALADALL